jgi:hypothetical protein
MFFFKGGKTVVQVETGEFSTFLLIRPDFLLQRMVVHKPTGMDVFHEEREPAPLKDTSDTCRLGTYKMSFGIHQDILSTISLKARRRGAAFILRRGPEDVLSHPQDVFPNQHEYRNR